MKIVSRLSYEEEQFQRLREIIEAATGGAISPDGELPPGEDLRELVTQVDITCASLMETLDNCENRITQLTLDNLRLSNHIAQRDHHIAPLMEAIENGIEYDDALDTATSDMMEAIVGSGAAEPTFDGEICFDATIPLSKEDLKPIVREAIESWIRTKVR